MKVKIEPTGIWEAKDYIRIYYGNNQYILVCREQMVRLLRGTGKRLPKHGTDEIVEIELTAK